MIFIASAWSPNMIVDDHLLFDFHQIDKQAFLDYSNYAYSCMNKPNLAKILGIEYNPEHVHLRGGDSLITVHIKGGKLLPFMDELPEDVILEFYCYTVYSPSTHSIVEK